MKAEELRLGNYLTFNDKLFTVAGISSPQNIRLYDGAGADQWEFIDMLKPIPLTEENVFRFAEVEKSDAYTGGIIHLYSGLKITVREYKGNWIMILRVGLKHFKTWENPKLHELQNLYFALTSTELTIK